MDLIGDHKFLEIPGVHSIELPPLLLPSEIHYRSTRLLLNNALKIVEQEAICEFAPQPEQSKFDMALLLTQGYTTIRREWLVGNAILEWIRQCEITFGSRPELKHILNSNVWPHAGRSSFVTLLCDKGIESFHGVNLPKAVGLRLNFREIPPFSCMTEHFIMYLEQPISASSYATWANKIPPPIHDLPPERFTFDTHVM